MTSITQVQNMMAAKMLKEVGATVEFTCRDSDAWTVNGSTEDAEKVMHYFSSNNMGHEVERMFDEELDEMFIYFVTGSKAKAA